jgi:hypothetical protein
MKWKRSAQAGRFLLIIFGQSLLKSISSYYDLSEKQIL